MISAVCTLFEGDYHYGVGALVNSLYTHGYRGTIFAGYRGGLPPWIAGLKQCDGFAECSPAEGLTLRFIPLTTTIHLTNFKVHFMLEVWDRHCPNAEALFYFDPDITIKCRWTFFEEWVGAGVAVCQDVNPSMPDNHPIRHAWRKSLQPGGLVFRNHLDNYFNAGFMGVFETDKMFLADLQRVLSLMKDCGADYQSLNGGDRSYRFAVPDQDAFNITCMVTQQNISPVGQDGMDFQHGGGGYIMSHAVGSGKPWNKKFIRNLLCRAAAPSRADNNFFNYLEFPIRLYPSSSLFLKRFSLLTARVLGRFIRNT